MRQKKQRKQPVITIEINTHGKGAIVAHWLVLLAAKVREENEGFLHGHGAFTIYDDATVSYISKKETGS